MRYLSARLVPDFQQAIAQRFDACPGFVTLLNGVGRLHMQGR